MPANRPPDAPDPPAPPRLTTLALGLWAASPLVFVVFALLGTLPAPFLRDWWWFSGSLMVPWGAVGAVLWMLQAGLAPRRVGSWLRAPAVGLLGLACAALPGSLPIHWLLPTWARWHAWRVDVHGEQGTEVQHPDERGSRVQGRFVRQSNEASTTDKVELVLADGTLLVDAREPSLFEPAQVGDRTHATPVGEGWWYVLNWD